MPEVEKATWWTSIVIAGLFSLLIVGGVLNEPESAGGGAVLGGLAVLALLAARGESHPRGFRRNPAQLRPHSTQKHSCFLVSCEQI